MLHSFSLLASVLLFLPASVSAARVGLHLGAPSGLSAAFDLGAQFVLHSSLSPPSDDGEFGVRLALVYNLPEVGGEVAELGRSVFWVGAGLRWVLDDEWRSQLGVRVPFGLSIFVIDAGEFYAEIAPVLVLHSERRALVEAGLGLRFGLF